VDPSASSPDPSFPGVVGHRRVTAMLSRAITRDRLHHGLVFSGPRGVGKAALARGLACALTCDVAPAVGCGQCDSCRRILGDRHTDLRWLLGQGKSRSITAASAREAALRTQHAPFEARAHVIVIDPADRMQPAAAAALLKSIEEPSPGVHWVLLATNLHNILDTIISRCMTIPLEPLGEADTKTVVSRAVAARGLEVDDGRRDLAISLAAGSPGLALELLADPSLEPTRELLAATLRAVQLGPPAIFGGDRSPLWSAWKRAVLETAEPGEREETAEATAKAESEVVVVKAGGRARKPKKVRAKKSKASAPKETPARQRATAGRLAELWLLHLRELLLGRTGLQNMPELEDHSGATVATHLQAIQDFQTALARNPNVRLSLEQLLLRLGPKPG